LWSTGGGRRRAIGVTMVPRRMRSVRIAIAPSATQGSTIGSVFGQFTWSQRK
jgi:hypothetical protein